MIKICIQIPIKDFEPIIFEAISSALTQKTDLDISLTFLICFENNKEYFDSMLKQFIEYEIPKLNVLHNIKYSFDLIHSKIKGVSPARNMCLLKMFSTYPDSDFMAILDSDDKWLENKLDKQLKFWLNNKQYDIIGAQIKTVGRFEYTSNYPLENNEIKDCLLNWNNCIAASTCLIKPEVFIKLGMYSDTYLYCDDYLLWLKAVPHFNFYNLPDVLAIYRTWENKNYNPRVAVLCKDHHKELYTTLNGRFNN